MPFFASCQGFEGYSRSLKAKLDVPMDGKDMLVSVIFTYSYRASEQPSLESYL